MKNFVFGFVIGLIAVGAAGFAFAWTMNVSALTKPGFMDTVLGSVSDHAVERSATDQKNPLAGSAKAVAEGLDYYKENCLFCHGAPHVPQTEASKGLNPPAPDLASDDSQGMSDGEMFWVISNGIRMTGMPAFSPTHSKKELWALVSFVRHLPKISPQEQQTLAASLVEEQTHPQVPPSAPPSVHAPAAPAPAPPAH